MRRNLLGGPLLALLSTAVALLLVEVGVRLTGLYVDEDLKRIRQEERLYYIRDPLLGWRGRPGAVYEVRGTTTGTVVHNNALGFRDREFGAKRPGTTRIAVLGDSFIWGYGATSVESRFSDRLERLLQLEGHNVEVYNFGISGWGTDQEYLAYRHVLSRLDPDLVILGYYTNDAIDNINRVGKPYYVLAGGELRLMNVPVPEATGSETVAYTPSLSERIKIFLAHRLYTYKILRNTLKRSDLLAGWLVRLGVLEDELEGHEPAYIEALARALLTRTCGAVRADGTQLLVLWIPDLYEVRSGRLSAMMRMTASIKERLVRTDLACPSLDLAPIFRAAMHATRKAFYQQYDGRHWDDDGNRLVAEEVGKFLRARGLPPYGR